MKYLNLKPYLLQERLFHAPVLVYEHYVFPVDAEDFLRVDNAVYSVEFDRFTLIFNRFEVAFLACKEHHDHK